MHRFLRLPAAKRYLLVNTLFVMIAIRLGLWVLPFRAITRLVTWACSSRRSGQPKSGSVADIVWAVAVVARRLPAATCLVQALTGQVLMNRAGYVPQIEFGVVRDAEGHLRAHAWIRCEGEVVIGGLESALKQYVPLRAGERSTP